MLAEVDPMCCIPRILFVQIQLEQSLDHTRCWEACVPYTSHHQSKVLTEKHLETTGFHEKYLAANSILKKISF